MRRLSKNFLFVLIGDVLRRVLGFLTVAYLARALGTSEFGLVNIGFTVLSYGLLAGAAGLMTFGIREVARGRGGGTFAGSIAGLRLAISFGAFILIAAVIWFIVPERSTVGILLLFSLSLFPNALLVDWYFQGKEQMGVVAAGRIASAALYLLLVIAFVRSPEDVVFVAVAAVAGDSLACGLLLAVYRRREGGLGFGIRPQEWRPLLRQSLPLGTGSILAHISINLPVLVVGIIMTNSDVGIFSAANKLVFFLLMLDRIVGTVLLPASSRTHARDPGSFEDKLSEVLQWVVLAGLPLSLGGTILSGGLISLIFGATYQSASIVFSILIWYFLFTVLHTVYSSVLIVIGEEKLYSRIMAASALLYAATTLMCTYVFGTIGTAIAVAGSELCTLAYTMWRTQAFKKVVLPKTLPRIAAASAVMGVVLIFLGGVGVLAAVAIGFAVYCAAAFSLRAVTGADMVKLLGHI